MKECAAAAGDGAVVAMCTSCWVPRSFIYFASAGACGFQPPVECVIA